jgi:hypothetical protein
MVESRRSLWRHGLNVLVERSMSSVIPVQSSSATGRSVVLPVSVRTPAAQEFAAIAQSAHTPTPSRFRLSASLPLTSAVARGPTAPAYIVGVYSEAEFEAEINTFLHAPGLHLVL